MTKTDWKNMISEAINFFVKDGLGALTDNLRGKVDDAIDATEHKVEVAARRTLKTVIYVLLFAIGCTFILVGIAKMLETMPTFANGGGFAVVGLVVVAVGVLARALR